MTHDVQRTIEAIMQCRAEKKGAGSIVCPKCKGVLNYTCAIGYNDHTDGKCQTEGCLSWIE